MSENVTKSFLGHEHQLDLTSIRYSVYNSLVMMMAYARDCVRSTEIGGSYILNCQSSGNHTDIMFYVLDSAVYSFQRVC